MPIHEDAQMAAPTTRRYKDDEANHGALVIGRYPKDLTSSTKKWRKIGRVQLSKGSLALG
jgi:hypothetical protein